MPPPQASGLSGVEIVTTSPLANVLVLVCPPLVPVTYVPKTPISNSFPRKYETGGGGGGATISFEGGGPAKETTACDPRATTAKASLFIMGNFYSNSFFFVNCRDAINSLATSLDRQKDRYRSRANLAKLSSLAGQFYWTLVQYY
jgi:hypothetical protein